LNDSNSNFNHKQFVTNPNRSIINIGAWLRNPYTIYTLCLPNLSVKKFKLKGKFMSEYFMPINYNITSLIDDLLNNINFDDYQCINEQIINLINSPKQNSTKQNSTKQNLTKQNSTKQNLTKQNSTKKLTKSIIKLFNKSNNDSIIETFNLIYSRSFTNFNYYILYLINYIKLIKRSDIAKNIIFSQDTIAQNNLAQNNLAQTEFDLKTILLKNNSETGILDYKNESEYINLFTDNIIFGHYIDCSASNTILECILYNTPIIVNNHPAIVEYLGKDYPLYYSEPIYDSEYKFKLDFTLEDISNAHKYLLNLDKTKFLPETFNENLNRIFLKYSNKPNKPNKSFNICKCFSKKKL
jgi:hypothetical protein